jgi:hypothetical protein
MLGSQLTLPRKCDEAEQLFKGVRTVAEKDRRLDRRGPVY